MDMYIFEKEGLLTVVLKRAINITGYQPKALTPLKSVTMGWSEYK